MAWYTDNIVFRKIMQLICALARRFNLWVTVNNGLAGAAIAGVATGAGLLVGGPLGIVMGAAVGGVMGMLMNIYQRPLVDALNRLTNEEGERLCMAAMNVLGWLAYIPDLVQQVLSDAELSSEMVGFIQSFFSTLNMSIQ